MMQLTLYFLNRARFTILRRMRSFLFILTPLVGLLLAPDNAHSSGLLIIYPKAKAPYNKIYDDIITGINERYPSISEKLQLTEDSDNYRLTEKIEQHKSELLLTLRQASLNKVSLHSSPIPVVAGAITKTEQIVPGISMSPAAEIMLSHLLQLTPFVEQVHVVITPQYRVQLEGAEHYLAMRGRSLHIQEIESIQEAADRYLNIIHQASPEDAIWLMRGASLNDSTIVMLVLNAAWRKKIIVFSSNPSHVRHGALFSLYPDNKKVGHSLAEIAQHYEGKRIPPHIGLTPLRSVRLIVNKLTYIHICIAPNNISGLTIHQLL